MYCCGSCNVQFLSVLSFLQAGYNKVYIHETLYFASLVLSLHQEAEAGADRLAGSGFVDLLQPVLWTAARGVVRQALVQVADLEFDPLGVN